MRKKYSELTQQFAQALQEERSSAELEALHQQSKEVANEIEELELQQLEHQRGSKGNKE